MMTLPKPAIKEFQALYKARFGQTIDYKTAELEGMQLIRLLNKIQPPNELNMKMDMETNRGAQDAAKSHNQKRAGDGKAR